MLQLEILTLFLFESITSYLVCLGKAWAAFKACAARAAKSNARIFEMLWTSHIDTYHDQVVLINWLGHIRELYKSLLTVLLQL